MRIPDFTPEQLRQLDELAVTPAQIEKLRIALTEVGVARLPRPARNDVRDTLVDVAKQAKNLKQLLERLALHGDAKRSAACNAIEEAYWKRRPHDGDATSMHSLISHLSALVEAAYDGIGALPQKQTYHRTAKNWVPIRAIESALLLGWSLDSSLQCDICVSASASGPYPREFRPSESVSSVFSQIVAICYEAAGAPRDTNPQAAIRAYLRARREMRNQARATFEKAST